MRERTKAALSSSSSFGGIWLDRYTLTLCRGLDKRVSCSVLIAHLLEEICLKNMTVQGEGKVNIFILPSSATGFHV